MTDTITELEFEQLRSEMRLRNITRTIAARIEDTAARAVADYWRAMSRPYAVAIHAEPNRTYPGHYVVTVQCPYCPGKHSHGWAGPGTVPGHRTPHCSTPQARQVNGRGYVVTIPADLEVPASATGRHFPSV